MNSEDETGVCTDDQIVESGDRIIIAVADGGDIDADESFVQYHIGKFQVAVVLLSFIDVVSEEILLVAWG